MNSRQTFSILFSSFWLGIHYVLGLKKNRSDSGALSALLDAFWNSPRLIQANNVTHYAGNCFVIELDQSFLDADHGRSSLMLLEDGKNLAQPNTRNLQDIVEKGAGRYIHANNKIYFSPTDNANLSQISERQYIILESLSEDQETVEQLLNLTNKSDQYDNQLLLGLEKLRVYFKNLFTFSGLSNGKNKLTLFNATLDLRSWFFGEWCFSSICVNRQAVNNQPCWNVTLKNIAINGIDAFFDLDATIIVLPNKEFAIQSIELVKDGDPCLSVNGKYTNSELQWINIQMHGLPDWVKMLTEVVGADEMAYRQWLDGFVNALSDGTLGYRCLINEEDMLQIKKCLSPRTLTPQLTLHLEKSAEDYLLKLVNDANKTGVYHE